MNRFQFAAIFFSLALLRDGLDQWLETAFLVAATISFLIGLRGK